MPYDPEVVISVVENFFKRSHFYNDTFDRERLNVDDLFESFWSLVPTRKVKTIRVRAFDGAWFQSKCLDFGLFRIERFSKEELDKLIDQEVTNTFYPYAKRDTDYLSQFCFSVEESLRDENLGDVSEPRSFILSPSEIKNLDYDRIDRDLPDVVIQLLALHDLDERTMAVSVPEAPYVLKLPFVFEVDDDLFTSPSRPALMSGMMPPFVDLEEDDEEEEPLILASSGLVFTHERELKLMGIVAKARKVLALTRLIDDWSFIEIAMGYLGKASVTDEPLDRILWYVTVLDALLGEKVPGFTGAMRRRLSNILATSEAEKKTVGNQFDEVYDFRSQLVHGKQYKKKARSDHLYEARELARQAITWFVDFVLFVDDSLRRQKVDYNSYPRRSELLAVLDHDHVSLQRLNSLISTLPKGFPTLEKREIY